MAKQQVSVNAENEWSGVHFRRPRQPSFEPKNGDERNAARNLRAFFLLYHHQCPCKTAFLSTDHLASVTDFSRPVLQALAVFSRFFFIVLLPEKRSGSI